MDSHRRRPPPHTRVATLPPYLMCSGHTSKCWQCSLLLNVCIKRLRLYHITRKASSLARQYCNHGNKHYKYFCWRSISGPLINRKDSLSSLINWDSSKKAQYLTLPQSPPQREREVPHLTQNVKTSLVGQSSESYYSHPPQNRASQHQM
jgi:hypothetical protein